jgi:hypothetical protein
VILGTAELIQAQDANPSVTLKRRNDLTDEDLRKQLLSIPETGFSQSTAAPLCSQRLAGFVTP